MMYSLLLAFGLATTASAHTIAQEASVNGVRQGRYNGFRVPEHDEPIKDVTSPHMSCNLGWRKPINTKVITMPGGATIGILWGHVNGGEQFPGDPDDPIHPSHLGSISDYLSPVDEFSDSEDGGDYKWFKISEDTYDPVTKKWAVNKMIDNDGWSNFTMPTCIPPGKYWLRSELVALHDAHKKGGAQFFMTCVRVEVTNTSGTLKPEMVRIQDSYSADDPGIHFNIWTKYSSYPPIGPRPIVCDGSSGPAPDPDPSADQYPLPTSSPLAEPAATPAPQPLNTTSVPVVQAEATAVVVQANAAPTAAAAAATAACARIHRGRCISRGQMRYSYPFQV